MRWTSNVKHCVFVYLSFFSWVCFFFSFNFVLFKSMENASYPIRFLIYRNIIFFHYHTQLSSYMSLIFIKLCFLLDGFVNLWCALTMKFFLTRIFSFLFVLSAVFLFYYYHDYYYWILMFSLLPFQMCL